MKKDLKKEALAIQIFFPQIYLACHRDHIRSRSTEKQISSHDASILVHLNAPVFRRPSTLAKHLRVSPSTFSEWTVRMESLGYLRTETDRNDGRKVIMKLTEEGQSAIQDFSVLDTGKIVQLLEKMTVQERELVLDGLNLLADFATKP